MHFFRGKENYDSWVKNLKTINSKIYCLTLKEGLEVSKSIFKIT